MPTMTKARCATVGCNAHAELSVMSREGRWEWLDEFCSRCACRWVSEGTARWLTRDEREQVAA